MDRDVVVDRLRRLLQRLEARRGVRHAAVGATDLNGSWSWSDGVGEARPDGSGAPMDPTTPWFLASVTKLYVAAVVLRLYERGLVGLDGPVVEYLPERLARGLHVLDGVDHTGRLTLEHLLGHLSGLPDWLEERPAGGKSLIEEILEHGDRGWSFEDAVTRARDQLSPHFPPSDPSDPKARIRYSDTNYQLLMVVAEHVTGEPMASLYDKLVFEPLGLTRTWLPKDSNTFPVGQPATVWIADQPLDRPRALASFGDLYATTEDVLRFGRAWAAGSLFDDPATATITTRRFHTFGVPRDLAALRAPSWPLEYGLGVMRFAPSRLVAGGRRIPALLGHTGATGSWLWHVPSLGVVVAGTVDQASAVAVPFKTVPAALPRT